MKNKILLIAGLIITLFVVSGCQKKIPEGEIKDFVMAFDFDKTYEEVNIASSVVTSSHYKEGVLQGKISTYTFIDKENPYHYTKTILSGDYYGNGIDQFDYYEKETITYLDEFGNVVAYEKEDGKITALQYRPEDMNILLNNFFYTNLEYGYHQGGTYYGDYIQANCANYYQYFRVDKTLNQLFYEIKSYYEDKDKKRINIHHKYNVNNLGMMIDLVSRSELAEDNTTYSETTMSCDYTTKYDKIYKF